MAKKKYKLEEEFRGVGVNIRCYCGATFSDIYLKDEDIVKEEPYEWGDETRYDVFLKCPVCGKNEARILGRTYNVGFIDSSSSKHSEEQQKYFKSTLQPWRDGVASQEFIDAYPDKADMYFTPEEKRKAKNVWKDLKGWHNREKSL